MFKKASALSLLSGLLVAAACARPVAAETRDGSVELVSITSGKAAADGDAIPARLTITGLDHAYRAQVELPSDARPVRVTLPAGLYAVDAASSLSGDQAVIPALSAPKLVVVAAGSVSTVHVRSADAQAPAVAALDAALGG